jgi:hypothetical protein
MLVLCYHILSCVVLLWFAVTGDSNVYWMFFFACLLRWQVSED